MRRFSAILIATDRREIGEIGEHGGYILNGGGGEVGANSKYAAYQIRIL